MGDLCNPRSLRALGQEGFVWRAFNIWVILIVAWCFLVSYRKPICWLHPWLLYSYMVIYYIYTRGPQFPDTSLLGVFCNVQWNSILCLCWGNLLIFEHMVVLLEIDVRRTIFVRPLKLKYNMYASLGPLYCQIADFPRPAILITYISIFFWKTLNLLGFTSQDETRSCSIDICSVL